jgi:hypothetical protein
MLNPRRDAERDMPNDPDVDADVDADVDPGAVTVPSHDAEWPALSRARIPLPPLARVGRRSRSGRAGALPPGWSREGVRDAVVRHLDARGDLRASETLLVIAHWLTRAGMSAVPAPTLRALVPGDALPLGTLRDHLQYLVQTGLLERVSPAVYRVTSLGAAVAEVLPDRSRVMRLRALRLKPPGARQTPRPYPPGAGD